MVNYDNIGNEGTEKGKMRLAHISCYENKTIVKWFDECLSQISKFMSASPQFCKKCSRLTMWKVVVDEWEDKSEEDINDILIKNYGFLYKQVKILERDGWTETQINRWLK